MPPFRQKLNSNQAVVSPDKLREQRRGYWRQIIALSIAMGAMLWIGWRSPWARSSPIIEVTGDSTGLRDSPAPLPVSASSLVPPVPGSTISQTAIAIVPADSPVDIKNTSDDSSVKKKPRKSRSKKSNSGDESTLDESTATGRSTN